MKPATFTNQAAQGDLFIRRTDSIPAQATAVKPDKGVYVLAHSETGHSHVIEATPNVTLFATDNPLLSYLQVIEATEATEILLRHLRTFDTHAPIVLTPGNYELRRQREYTPEGWRMVVD